MLEALVSSFDQLRTASCCYCLSRATVLQSSNQLLLWQRILRLLVPSRLCQRFLCLLVPSCHCQRSPCLLVLSLPPLECPRGPFSTLPPLKVPRGTFSHISPLEGLRGFFSHLQSTLEGPRDPSSLQGHHLLNHLRLPCLVWPCGCHATALSGSELEATFQASDWTSSPAQMAFGPVLSQVLPSPQMASRSISSLHSPFPAVGLWTCSSPLLPSLQSVWLAIHTATL